MRMERPALLCAAEIRHRQRRVGDRKICTGRLGAESAGVKEQVVFHRIRQCVCVCVYITAGFGLRDGCD